jgi:hypothetical protein
VKHRCTDRYTTLTKTLPQKRRIYFFSDCHHIKFQGHTLPEWRFISYISSSD